MLKIKNVSVQYKEKMVLKDINEKFNKPEIIGLVAPNGTGKTTLLRTIAGLIQPKMGDISINGMTITEDREIYYKRMYFVENNTTLYPNLKGIDHISYVKSVWDSPINIKDVIQKLGISDYVNLPIKKLSLGMKQHILLAMCIVSNAEVILLDEPMNGLDPTSIKKISHYLKEMKENNKIIILSSHILSNIDIITDRVLFLKDCTIAYSLDMKNEDISSESIYDKLYGQEIKI